MVKGISYTFANGETYIIPPLSLGALEVVQESVGLFDGTISRDSVKAVTQAALLALQRNYPELTEEKVKHELLDISNMLDVMQAVMDVGGLLAKAASVGEQPPVTV
ncbi:MAG: hypothetical protein WCH05_05510 [Chlorobiaceae bacterium]